MNKTPQKLSVDFLYLSGIGPFLNSGIIPIPLA
jgi:hypothetical protein